MVAYIIEQISPAAMTTLQATPAFAALYRQAVPLPLMTHIYLTLQGSNSSAVVHHRTLSALNVKQNKLP